MSVEILKPLPPKDLEDFRRTVLKFDEDGIIRDYGQKEKTTWAPPTSSRHNKPSDNEYFYYHPQIYQNANDKNPCTDKQFRCANNVCIPLHLRCDGMYHCNDMSDEINCQQYQVSTKAPPTRRPTTTRGPDNFEQSTRSSWSWWGTTAAPATMTTAKTTSTTTVATPSRMFVLNVCGEGLISINCGTG